METLERTPGINAILGRFWGFAGTIYPRSWSAFCVQCVLYTSVDRAVTGLSAEYWHATRVVLSQVFFAASRAGARGGYDVQQMWSDVSV